MTREVVLLGDSIFDNAAYVPGEPDVVAQLASLLPNGWAASLRAQDGAVLADVAAQLDRLPGGAELVVVSAGGNDALGRIQLLGDPVTSIADALAVLAEISAEFQRGYRRMLDAVLRAGLRTAVCTIYFPRFPDPYLQRVAVAGLAHFNDAILRHAFAARLDVLDLRLICHDDADYANAIEPSAGGGAKIAAQIASLVAEIERGDQPARGTVVHTGVLG